MIRKTLSGAAPFALAIGIVTPAFAQDDICMLIEDPLGDVGNSFTQDLAGTDQFPMVDLEWIGMSDDGENYTFHVKVADLSQVPMQTAWTVNFTAPDGLHYTAAMQTDAGGNASYILYRSESAIDDDALLIPERLTMTMVSGEYDADGHIRIVVPSADVGAAANSTIAGLVSRVRVGFNPARSPTPDNAPNDLEPVGIYSLGGNCSKSATFDENKAFGTAGTASQGAGALGGLLILATGLLGLRRRKA